MKTTISANAEAQATRLRAKAKDLRREWYEIRNVAPDGAVESESTPVVYIYGEIGDSCWGDSVSASTFVREFAAIDSDEIELHVNSPGGDVWEGIAIANAIREHRAQVTATVDAIAASAASFIACAADTLVMGRNSELMIHDAFGLCVGNAGDMRDLADRLDTVSNNIASMYAEKAGGDVAEWRDVMLAETWYSAEEAVAAGLADRVSAKKGTTPNGEDVPEDVSNVFDLSAFAHRGRAAAHAPQIRAHKPPAPPADPTTTPPEGPDVSDRFLAAVRDRLGVKDASASEDDVLLALDETLDEQTAPTPAAATLPDGFVAIDKTVLAELQAGSTQGAEARAEQKRAARQSIVDDALADGRLAKTSEQNALELLERDDEAGTTTYRDFLAGLPKNSAVPMASHGYTGDAAEAGDDETDVTKTPAYTNWRS